jgi:hypothetical protein
MRISSAIARILPERHHMLHPVFRDPRPSVLVCVLLSALAAACGRTEAPPGMATPSVSVNKDEVPLGGPLETTYRFVVADGTRFTENYRVMVHFLDADDAFMWADDFDPPTPTTEWQPGQTIEFTRTTFLPIYPYVGDATIQVGLYSAASGERVPLVGDDMGQQAYRGARLHLLAQTSSIFTVYKEGWQGVETAPEDPGTEWQWSKKDGVLAFKNPSKDCVLYLDVDNPSIPKLGPQQVTVSIEGQTIDSFTIESPARVLRKVPISQSQFGSAEMVELHIAVDKTFVPAELDSTTRDNRELGVRVFHAYVDNR